MSPPSVNLIQVLSTDPYVLFLLPFDHFTPLVSKGIYRVKTKTCQETLLPFQSQEHPVNTMSFINTDLGTLDHIVSRGLPGQY